MTNNRQSECECFDDVYNFMFRLVVTKNQKSNLLMTASILNRGESLESFTKKMFIIGENEKICGEQLFLARSLYICKYMQQILRCKRK